VWSPKPYGRLGEEVRPRAPEQSRAKWTLMPTFRLLARCFSSSQCLLFVPLLCQPEPSPAVLVIQHGGGPQCLPTRCGKVSASLCGKTGLLNVPSNQQGHRCSRRGGEQGQALARSPRPQNVLRVRARPPAGLRPCPAWLLAAICPALVTSDLPARDRAPPPSQLRVLCLQGSPRAG